MSENQKLILKTIAGTLAFGAALVAPNILQLLKPKGAKEKYKYKKTLDKLFRDDVIYLSGEKIELTDKGKDLLKIVQVEDFVINDWHDDKAWDGVWHVVCYDIPERFKDARDQLRYKLIEARFYQVQLSLWACPFECKEEIAIISQNLGVAPFVAYLNTDYLPHQNEILHHFGLDS